MNFITKHAFLFLIITFLLLLTSVYFLIFHPRTEVKEIHTTQIDTVKTLVTEYKEVVKKDTVVKWYEKPVKEIIKPEKIYVQKIDSVIIVQYKDHDLIINIKKLANKDLQVWVINEQNKVMKESIYHDVGDIFDISSVTNGVVVKSQFLQWNGIGPYINHSSALKWKNHNYEAGIKTGLNYLDKFNFDVKAGYDFNLKDLRLSEELTYYPFR